MAESPEVDTVVMRCQATVIRGLTGRCAEREIAELVGDLFWLPDEHAEVPRIAAGMLMAMFRGNVGTGVESAGYVGDLLRFAEADPPSDPQWDRVRSIARMSAFLHSGTQGELTDVAPLTVELDALAATFGNDPAMVPVFGVLRTMSGLVKAMEEGNESVLRRAPDELASYGEQLQGHPDLASLLGSVELLVRGLAANQRGDPGEMLEYLDLSQESIQNQPGQGHLRQLMADAETRIGPYRALLGDSESGAFPTEEQIMALQTLANRSDATYHDRALSQLALGGAFMRAGEETDLSRIDTGIAHFRKALDLLPPDHPQHAFCLQSVALGLFRRSELAGNTDGLVEADELLERARSQLGGPQHPHWVLANEMLSSIRQRNDRDEGSEEIGLIGQRGYAWRALLESDAAGAKIAIRDASRGAIDLARRCLKADNIVAALQALDTCRGLMLFAATEFGKVPARLAAAGHADLARQWEAEGAASAELRHEVLSVLTQLPDEAGNLLDPPDMAAIRSALAELDADALVYLVPAESPQPGFAVIAPVDGPPAWMALPNLSVNDDTDVERFLTAIAARSRDLASAQDGDAFTGSLDALCDWAWQTAVGPLLNDYFGRRTPRHDNAVPRIVLIPMGDLARIPWQAARRGDGVYAIQLAAFSQAASARLLCENAAREPIPLSAAGLVVGDPDTESTAEGLDAARLEAHVVRQVFYPGARYVGRRPNGTVSPSGRGTADEVRRWLADPRLGAGSMLHLACHGSFAAGLDDASSCLMLASADPGDSGGDELAAEEILELLAAHPHRHVGLVVLAACNTGRSVHGYDEAYSLGTAFLTGGARSVLSTQWSIPDAQTPSLMFLFHYYCRDGGLPPWQALRQAQIWMLNPERRPPDRMPAEFLHSVPRGEPAPVDSWAGFIHFGQ